MRPRAEMGLKSGCQLEKLVLRSDQKGSTNYDSLCYVDLVLVC